MSEKANINRSEIGDCRGCGAKVGDVELSGIFNRFGTHYTSECGWWLYLDHNYDLITSERQKDTVSTFFCPKCTKEHNERLKDIF